MIFKNVKIRKIGEAVKNEGSMSSARSKLGIGKSKMYAMKDGHGGVISIFDDTVKGQQTNYILNCTVLRAAT